MNPPLVRHHTIALAGNPNAGKTTLFNALTGLRQKVANYPGITVEKKSGWCLLAGRGQPDARVEIIDLPGTYSLVPDSPDEAVTMSVLRGLRPDTPAPGALIAVVDASNLARNLFLVSQLIELNRPLLLALNMSDIATRRGLRVDAAALSLELGVPVVPVIGHRSQGIAELKILLADSATLALPTPPAWILPPAFEAAITKVAASVTASAISRSARLTARRLLTEDVTPDLDHLRRVPAIAAALTAAYADLVAAGIDAVQTEITARYAWIDGVIARCVQSQPQTRRTLSERIDGILLHRVIGLVIFAMVMAALFTSIFWLAGPLMTALQDAVTGLGTLVTGRMADGPLKALLADGVFAGVGAVVVFVPQIALLFLFLAILEDSGYLARAAFLMDRLLARVGLHGKSFIPLLSSFACAIPGIMATRTIDSPRERLATILVAPFMSCSARLPVYGLLIGAFFAQYGALVKGLIMLGCYVLGIVAAAATAWAFKLATRRHGRAAAFILELPTYKWPQASLVLRQVWSNATKFLTKAGTTIFCLSVLLWALAYYPRAPQERLDAAAAHAHTAAAAQLIADEVPTDREVRLNSAGDRAQGQEQLAYSIAGRIGHTIEPVIAPLGFDWKIGVGLVGAFAAREVFNSTLSIIYALGSEAEDVTPLEDAIRADRRADGTPVWRPLVAVSLLVWFVLAMQCISTTAVVRRETGGWTWPLVQIAFMNVVAYIACFAVFQLGSRLGY